MINFKSHNKSIKSILLPLVFALHATACSTEDSATTEDNTLLNVQEYIDRFKETGSNTNQGTNQEDSGTNQEGSGTNQEDSGNNQEGSGTNQAAVINGDDSGSVTKDLDPDGDELLEVGGKLDITDLDTGESAFISQTINGNFGQLTINAAGNWNYTANNSQPAIQNLTSGRNLQDHLTVSSLDGTTHIVTITIIGVDGNITLTSVNLSWTAPTERENFTSISLSEIAGYKVYHSVIKGEYTTNVMINDSSITSHTIPDLESGTHYFTVTTIDTDGQESKLSTEVKVVI